MIFTLQDHLLLPVHSNRFPRARPGSAQKIIGQLHLRITHPIPDKKEQILRRSRLHLSLIHIFRLVDRGFLSTEKQGKERTYYPLVSKEEYLK